MSGRRQVVAQLAHRYGLDTTDVLKRLRRARAVNGQIESADVGRIADDIGLPGASARGATSFYADLGFQPIGRRHVRVCVGTACFAASGGSHIAEVERELDINENEISADGEASVEPVHCLGYCYGGPTALDGEEPCAGPDLLDQLTGKAERVDPEMHFDAAVAEPVLLAGLTGSGPDSWSVWPEIVGSCDRQKVIDEVLASGLRGRGGGGFPTARKWEMAADSPTDSHRYLICNADEGDPGSYIDRLLMERDPGRVLEGMALAALAARADKAFIYVRSEYPRARDILRKSIAEARSAGHLGTDIQGSGTDLDIEVFEGAGSYVAGEETSLIHSMEGLRGGVSSRPPYPTEKGLFNRPTVVNNVETLAAVPWIVSRGGDQYASMGAEKSKGTKLVCLNERFSRPGVYEVEFGTSIRWICEDLAGGIRDSHELKALQVGGPLGGFLAPDELDTELSFEELAAAGAALGHGSLIAIDERISGRRLLTHLMSFAASESCGSCTPCSAGTRRALDTAVKIEAEGPSRVLLDELEGLMEAMRASSLCAFGTSLHLPVRGVMRIYKDEFTREKS